MRNMLFRALRLTAVAAMLFAVVPAYAQDYAFTGAAGDGLWGTPDNWDPSGPPPDTAGSTFLGPNHITIPAGETYTPGLATSFATIFGPDWGGTLNIHGTLQYNWYLAPVSTPTDPTSNVNLYGNAHISGEGVAIGHNWWYNGGPNAALNLYDDSTININWMWWGGHVNLFGGTLEIAGGVVADTVDAVSDATRMMNITKGQLVLDFPEANSAFQSWIGRGIVQAYGGSGELIIDSPSPDHLIITALLPGDANLDGQVNIADLGILAGNWQQTNRLWEHGDFNGDGIVDIADLGILAGNWQVGSSGTSALSFTDALGMFDVLDGTAIPEPAIAGMLGLVGVLALRRRS